MPAGCTLSVNTLTMSSPRMTVVVPPCSLATNTRAVRRLGRVVRHGAGDDLRFGRAAGQVDAHQGVGALDGYQNGPAGLGQLEVAHDAGQRDALGDLAGVGVQEHQLVRIALGDGDGPGHRVDDHALRCVADRHDATGRGGRRARAPDPVRRAVAERRRGAGCPPSARRAAAGRWWWGWLRRGCRCGTCGASGDDAHPAASTTAANRHAKRLMPTAYPPAPSVSLMAASGKNFATRPTLGAAQIGQPAARSLAIDSSDDYVGAGEHLGADADHRPTRLLQQGDPLDVPRSLPCVGPVLHAVVLDRDLPFPPAHVHAHAHASPAVSELDLSLRARQPRVDQDQSQPGFLRRFGPAVDEARDVRSAVARRGRPAGRRRLPGRRLGVVPWRRAARRAWESRAGQDACGRCRTPCEPASSPACLGCASSRRRAGRSRARRSPAGGCGPSGSPRRDWPRQPFGAVQRRRRHSRERDAVAQGQPGRACSRRGVSWTSAAR